MWSEGVPGRWVVVITLVWTAGQSQATCPSGWFSMPSGKCYKIVTSLTAVNACTCSLRKVCWELGGELVSMETATEETDLLSVMNTQFGGQPASDRPRHLLLGLTDLDTEGAFQWLDGSPLSHTRWRQDSPDDGGADGSEDCVAIEAPTGDWDVANTAWVDIPCCFNELAISTTLCEAEDDNFTTPGTNILADACFGSCPEGWWALGADLCMSILEMYGAGFENPLNARLTCRQHGGDLPVLDTQEKLDMALAVMRVSNRTAKPTKMFLGLWDINIEGAYVWADGSTYTPGSPMNITQSDTGTHNENCVMMTSSDDLWLPGNSTIAWEDHSCCTDHPAISQALCMRTVVDDLDLAEYDVTIAECTGSPKYFCPRGAFYYQSYGICYNFFLAERTYAEAEAICSATDGSQLVSILDSNEKGLVEFKAAGYEWWIGLDDRAAEGEWKWTDGSMYSFENFATNEPDQLPGDGDCVSLDPFNGLKWQDSDCGTAHSFICKRQNMFSM